METIPKKAVVAAAVVLVALSLFGAYQGWRRSAVDDTQTAADGSPLPVTAAVAGARQASALVEAPPTPLNEAQVREIARQEVRASLRGDTSASSGSASTSSSASGAGSSTAAAPTPPRPAPPPPAPIAVPAPPPESAPSTAAPLF